MTNFRILFCITLELSGPRQRVRLNDLLCYPTLGWAILKLPTTLFIESTDRQLPITTTAAHAARIKRLPRKAIELKTPLPPKNTTNKTKLPKPTRHRHTAPEDGTQKRCQ